MVSGLAGMTLGDAYVNIMGDTAGLQRGLLQAHSMVTGFVASTGSFVKRGISTAMVAVPAAIGGAMAYSVKSFMESEIASKRLASSIAVVGGNVDILLPKYERLADIISRKTKWEDESVKSAMASALALGMSTSKMEKAVPAAVGLAARLNMDLSTAMRLVTRASFGQTQMLQRYGLVLGQNLTLEQKYQKVLEFGRGGLKMAREEVNTISGAFAQMRKATGEVFESIGGGLVGSGAFKEVLQGITNKIWGLKDAIDNLIAGGTFRLWIDTVIGGFRYMANDIKYVGTMLWTLLVEPLARTVGYIVDRLMEISNVLYEVGNTLIISMVGVFQYIGRSLGSLANAIVSSLWEPIEWATGNIGTIFENLFTNIKNTAKAAWEFIKSPGEGWKAPEIKNIFTGTDSFENQLNLMGESWKAFSNDVTDSSPFQGTIDQLKTLKASLQTLGQGFITNPFAGWIDKIMKTVEDYWATNAKISASLGKTAEKKYGRGTPLPKPEEVSSKASFSVISLADQWKKLQEGAAKNKEAKETADAAKETAKNTKRMADSMVSAPISTSPLFSPGY